MSVAQILENYIIAVERLRSSAFESLQKNTSNTMKFACGDVNFVQKIEEIYTENELKINSKCDLLLARPRRLLWEITSTIDENIFTETSEKHVKKVQDYSDKMPARMSKL